MTKNTTVLLVTLFMLANISTATTANTPKKERWAGHTLHGSVGFIADQIRHTQPEGSKINIRGNATFFYGYDYGWHFADNWFWSLGAEWTIAYPRNFLPNSDAWKKTAAWIQPLTHVRIGYVFPNDALLTVGLTYLWALSANFRVPLGEHLFVETQYLQWFDGIFNIWKLSPTLGAAFDFANFSWGFGWKF